MDGKLLLRLERCVGYQALFPMCRCCYHAPTYYMQVKEARRWCSMLLEICSKDI